jgi:hypothetical protein
VATTRSMEEGLLGAKIIVSTRKHAKTSEPAPETGSEEEGVLLQQD